MKERFEIWFRWISNLGNLVKLGTYVVVAGTFVVTMIARHDTNVKMDFIKTNKTISKADVDSIFTVKFNPINSRIQTIIDNQVVLFDNQEIIKDGFIDHVKMDKTAGNTDIIINVLNGFKRDIITEIKKNELLNLVQQSQIQLITSIHSDSNK